jgi:hypothetical protein
MAVQTYSFCISNTAVLRIFSPSRQLILHQALAPKHIRLSLYHPSPASVCTPFIIISLCYFLWEGRGLGCRHLISSSLPIIFFVVLAQHWSLTAPSLPTISILLPQLIQPPLIPSSLSLSATERHYCRYLPGNHKL